MTAPKPKNVIVLTQTAKAALITPPTDDAGVREFTIRMPAPEMPPPVDEFEAEARALLHDDGSRSWTQVELDVAEALRRRAGVVPKIVPKDSEPE